MEDCIILNSYRINHQWNRCVIRVTWIVPPFCCFATCVWFPQIKKTWIHLIWEDWLILIGPETSRKQWWCISHRPKMANRKRSTGRWTKILDHAAIKCSHFNRFFHARGHHIPTGPWPTSSRHPHVLRDEHLQLPSCAVSACHKTSSGTCPVQPTAMFKHGNCNLQHFFRGGVHATKVGRSTDDLEDYRAGWIHDITDFTGLLTCTSLFSSGLRLEAMMATWLGCDAQFNTQVWHHECLQVDDVHDRILKGWHRGGTWECG